MFTASFIIRAALLTLFFFLTAILSAEDAAGDALMDAPKDLAAVRPYLAVTGGAALPLGKELEFLTGGAAFGAGGGFLFDLQVVEAALGAEAVYSYSVTGSGVSFPYALHAFGLGLTAGIGTTPRVPFRLILEGRAGISFSSLVFLNQPEVKNSLNFFFSFNAGVSSTLFKTFEVAQLLGVTIILYEAPVYVALTPSLRISVRL